MTTTVLQEIEDRNGPVLEIENVGISVEGKRLLGNVTVRLKAGELVTIAGPSGCGKTTLLRAIAGLIDTDEGGVRLDGKAPSDLGWPLFRRQVILVDQRPVLFDETVRSNLERPFQYRHGRGQFPEDRAMELLHLLGIEAHRISQDARSLSVGQQQRVSLIRALLLNPRVLLLDEPTSALDTKASEAVERLLLKMAHEEGLSALVVTHNPEQAKRLGDHVVELVPVESGGGDTP